MAKDLNTKEGRSSFLKDYLDDLLVGINDSYGPTLLKELEGRLEKTINEFNDEIDEAFSLLKKKTEDKEAFYASLENNSDKSSKTEWEKKLEDVEK
tara:strand:+ start:189 stop:476 length:288 start_codon:yes stop_codon:yes gene_type:complete